MTEEKVKMEEKEFVLPNRKIKVSYIKRKGGWLPDHHIGAGLHQNSIVKYFTPKKSKHGFVEVLTPAETKTLSAILRRDLSPYLEMEKNYWREKAAILRKNDRILDLSNPEEYIEYKILLVQKDEVAPNVESRLKKGTYRFVLCELDYEDTSRAKKAEQKRKAFKEFEKMSESRDLMMDFLTTYYYKIPGKRVPEGAKIEWLQAEIDKIIEDDLDGFLKIVVDPDREHKLLIGKALNKRILAKEGSTYSFFQGAIIARNLDNLLLWFKDPRNSEEVTKIEAKVNS